MTRSPMLLSSSFAFSSLLKRLVGRCLSDVVTEIEAIVLRRQLNASAVTSRLTPRPAGP